ncbi:MAG: hypothetical protein ABSE73_05375 [Planctomycetota bacterium]
MHEPKRPSVSTNLHLPLNLLERIKDAARRRSVHECRHVPYVELVREALEAAFLAKQPGAQEPGTN